MYFASIALSLLSFSALIMAAPRIVSEPNYPSSDFDTHSSSYSSSTYQIAVYVESKYMGYVCLGADSTSMYVSDNVGAAVTFQNDDNKTLAWCKGNKYAPSYEHSSPVVYSPKHLSTGIAVYSGGQYNSQSTSKTNSYTSKYGHSKYSSPNNSESYNYYLLKPQQSNVLEAYYQNGNTEKFYTCWQGSQKSATYKLCPGAFVEDLRSHSYKCVAATLKKTTSISAYGSYYGSKSKTTSKNSKYSSGYFSSKVGVSAVY